MGQRHVAVLGPVHRPDQVGQEEGPGDQAVHAALGQYLVDLLRLGIVAAEQQHRVPGALPQGLHRVRQVRVVEIAVEQDHVRRVARQLPPGLALGGSQGEGHVCRPQGRAHVPAQHVVVGDQHHLPVPKTVLHPVVDGEGEHHVKAAALAGLALDLDGPAHQVHDVLGDGHAQAGALDLVGHGVLRPGEGLEDVGHKLRRHAIAVVLHRDAEGGVAGFVTGQLRQVKAHVPAIGGILHRVGQQVQKDLPQAHPVADEIFVGHLVDPDAEALPPLVGLGADDAVHLTHLLGQTDGVLVQGHLAGLDLAHVQHIVDQTEQMAAGHAHLFNIGVHLVRGIRLVGHQVGDAHDGVHGGADVVGHVGEEFAFGLVGGHQLGVEPFQLGVVLLCDGHLFLLLAALHPENKARTHTGHQHGKGHDHDHRGIDQLHRVHGHGAGVDQKDQRPLGILHAVHGVEILLPVQNGIGVYHSAGLQLLPGRVEGRPVEILHPLQRIIDVIAMDQLVALAAEQLQSGVAASI